MIKKNLKYILIIIVFLGSGSQIFAQKLTKIEILHSNFFRSDKNIGNGARRLIGNVEFRQDSTIMKCDSAYYYAEQNMFEAFSNVRLYKKGDKSVEVKSDFLRHDGNTKMAKFRNHVVMRDPQVVLYTDSLDYDTRRDIGYYIYGGKIVDSATTLTSQKGYYYHHNKEIFFKKNVVVNHNSGEFEIYTDTLKYNTGSKIAYILGPTEIYNDTNYMYAEFGWYNTENNKALFKKNALYKNLKQSITADSLFYDRDNEHGLAYSNVVVTDTLQQLIIKGNFLEVFENEERFLVTDKALVISILEGDSLFMHADTILTEYDTTGINRTFKAFRHVNIFKSNFQCRTDSLFFSMADSIVEFHGNPVLWAEKNQITANYIEGFIVDNKLDKFKLYDGGLIASQVDTAHFNQIKGSEMTGYLKNNELYKIDVFKKSETIYFPSDVYGILGANKSASGNITIYLKENEISRIVYRDAYTGQMHPLIELSPKDMLVRDFEWLDIQRPKSAEDVFIWEDRTINTSKSKTKKNKTSLKPTKTDK